MEEILLTVEFDTDEIQSFAEANFGRELTKVELDEIKMSWYLDEDVCWSRTQLLASAIKMAIKSSDIELAKS
ncbi:MAG: hypothetical protein ABA06_04435 [Parcubacteria bacterium C7867-001]|nr:MAG: hypothetical protein ABA06_04435 [Parcubacteria bacterium C7867-001]